MATLILRPNGDGSELSIPWYYNVDNYYESGANTNWPMVDEVTPDGQATSVGDIGGAPQPHKRDLYVIPDHTTESGVINFVKVYIRVLDGVPTAKYRHYKPCLRTNGTTVDGDEITGGLTDEWITYSQSWAVNPVTTDPWTWDEIDALEIGVSVEKATAGSPLCTQVYVEVDYTPPLWTETLRPNAAGDKTEWVSVVNSTHHGACGDESDETYIQNNTWTNEDPYRIDLFNIPSLEGEPVTITKIIVTVRCKQNTDYPDESVSYSQVIKTGGEEYEHPGTIDDANWKDYSYEWTLNPKTGVAWTIADITNLQIGAKGQLRPGSAWDAYTMCSEVWVDVYCSLLPPPTARSFGIIIG
ncbi:hypothetical protein ES703_47743 [subsurface metagenome]